MIAIADDITALRPTGALVGHTYLLAAMFHDNGDGTVSVQMPDGSYASPDPLQYNHFTFAAAVGPYERAMINGQLLAFWTRPEDVPQVYSWVTLPS